MAADPVREGAVEVLLQVFEKGAFVEVALDRKLRRRKVSERGGRFLAQLVYGTVRHKRLCEHVLDPVLKSPFDELPPPIQAILRMGVFQALFCDNVTFPAMVHTSVDVAKKKGHIGLAKLTNAVLKRIPQKLDDIPFPDPRTDRLAYLCTRYSFQEWMVERWLREFGDETEAICAGLNDQAPTALRANLLKTTLDELQGTLEKSECVVDKATPIPEELTYVSGPNVARLKAFQRGEFMIQDPASMLPPHLLEPTGAGRVLDMCAAPGGKSTHLATLAPEATVVANDNHLRKLSQVADNCERLGVENIALVCSDGGRPAYTGGFDRVLVDAPCSGLGTIRRHPDLKWRLKPDGPGIMAEQQRALLRAAIGLCENRGVVVYSVCTFTPEETQGVIGPILDTERVELEDGPEWLNPWKIMTGTYRTLPNLHGLDGFYLTRLRKSS